MPVQHEEVKGVSDLLEIAEQKGSTEKAMIDVIKTKPISTLVSLCDAYEAAVAENKQEQERRIAAMRRVVATLHSPAMSGHWKTELSKPLWQFASTIMMPARGESYFSVVRYRYHARAIFSRISENSDIINVFQTESGTEDFLKIAQVERAAKLGSVYCAFALFLYYHAQIQNGKNKHREMHDWLKYVCRKFKAVGHILAMRYYTERYHAYLEFQDTLNVLQALKQIYSHGQLAQQLQFDSKAYLHNFTLGCNNIGEAEIPSVVALKALGKQIADLDAMQSSQAVRP